MKKVDPIIRFNQKYIKENSCWIWVSALNSSGYGQIYINGTTKLAHRFSYEIHKGLISNGLHVCHTCDNPKCVNPDHLFLGTNKDNVLDKLNKSRHPVGSNAKNSKITEIQAISIKKDSRSNREIAKDYGISHQVVCGIKNNKYWKHANA